MSPPLLPRTHTSRTRPLHNECGLSPQIHTADEVPYSLTTSICHSPLNQIHSIWSNQEWWGEESILHGGRRILGTSKGSTEGCQGVKGLLTVRPRVLKPGGWVQMIELYWMCQSDNGSLTDAHPLRRWSDNYIRSLEGIKDSRVPLRLHGLCSAAGFVEVEHKMIPLPLCGWSSGM